MQEYLESFKINTLWLTVDKVKTFWYEGYLRILTKF